MLICMRNLIFFCLLMVTVAAEPAFDAKRLDEVASLRAQAVKKSLAKDQLGTDDNLARRQGYFSALKIMIGQLHAQYYQHKEFPADLCEGLETHAEVLAGIEYPMSPYTGASGYDAILIDAKIRLAEDLICQMSRSIFEKAYPKTSKQDVAAEQYQAWLKRWNAQP